jgi:hypothetical protein
MNQQAYQKQVSQSNENVIRKVVIGIGRLLVATLKMMGRMTRKIGANIWVGFEIFIGTVEDHGLPRK